MNTIRLIACTAILLLATGCATQNAGSASAPTTSDTPSAGISAKELKELGIKETQGSY